MSHSGVRLYAIPERILKFYTKYFAVWVVAFGIVAYFLPGPFVAVKDYNQAFFAVTMFGIGAVLEIADFKRIAERPVLVLIGVSAQYLIMPFGAFVISRLLGLPPVIAAGLILTGCAPGAMASNVMCYISKADTAYSISLTTVSTLLCPLLTPGLTALLATKVPVPFAAMFEDAMLMIIVPLLLGFAVRHFFGRWIKKIVFVFPAVSVTFIIFICSLVIALNKDRILEVSAVIAAGVLVLNLFGMSAGYGVGALFRMDSARRRTLSIEIGMQNAGLGSTLALTHLGKEAALPAALFVFTCIITASIAGAVWHRRQIRLQPEKERAYLRL